LGCFKKNALAFADGQIEPTDHAKDELFFGEAKFTTGGRGERWVLGLESLGIDPGVDNVEFCGIDPAGGAMVSFGNGGSGVVMAFQEDLSDEGGNGDDRIGGGEEMFLAEGGAGAFGKVAGKDNEGAGLDETRCEECSPVVVSMVGVKDAWLGSAENSCQGKNLEGAEAGQRVVGKFLGGGSEGCLSGTCNFHRPSQIGEALGEGEGLRIGATPTKVGVEVDQASGEIRRGHRKHRLAQGEGRRRGGELGRKNGDEHKNGPEIFSLVQVKSEH
jgi:hypothetical protein